MLCIIRPTAQFLASISAHQATACRHFNLPNIQTMFYHRRSLIKQINNTISGLDATTGNLLTNVQAPQ